MTANDDTDELLRKLNEGDTAARQHLLDRHRARLTEMVAMRMDRRLKARFDPSDVVQESLLIADQRLSDYARQREIPFYPWLRGLAWDQLLKHYAKHVDAKRRSVSREQHVMPAVNDESIDTLVHQLAAKGSSPSEHAIRKEQRARVRRALAALGATDREVIELRYLEQLSNDEIAAVLGIGTAAVRARVFRAIRKLNRLLGDDEQWASPNSNTKRKRDPH